MNISQDYFIEKYPNYVQFRNDEIVLQSGHCAALYSVALIFCDQYRALYRWVSFQPGLRLTSLISVNHIHVHLLCSCHVTRSENQEIVMYLCPFAKRIRIMSSSDITVKGLVKIFEEKRVEAEISRHRVLKIATAQQNEYSCPPFQ